MFVFWLQKSVKTDGMVVHCWDHLQFNVASYVGIIYSG